MIRNMSVLIVRLFMVGVKQVYQTCIVYLSNSSSSSSSVLSHSSNESTKNGELPAVVEQDEQGKDGAPNQRQSVHKDPATNSNYSSPYSTLYLYRYPASLRASLARRRYKLSQVGMTNRLLEYR